MAQEVDCAAARDSSRARCQQRPGGAAYNSTRTAGRPRGCIIHLIRNTFRLASKRDWDALKRGVLVAGAGIDP
jgi:hypothetical protein